MRADESPTRCAGRTGQDCAVRAALWFNLVEHVLLVSANAFMRPTQHLDASSAPRSLLIGLSWLQSQVVLGYAVIAFSQAVALRTWQRESLSVGTAVARHALAVALFWTGIDVLIGFFIYFGNEPHAMTASYLLHVPNVLLSCYALRAVQKDEATLLPR